tara:strand:+ start:427 stop:759 length:333 start_codon:yes stop_codon:yes gene_type:complete
MAYLNEIVQKFNDGFAGNDPMIHVSDGESNYGRKDLDGKSTDFLEKCEVTMGHIPVKFFKVTERGTGKKVKAFTFVAQGKERGFCYGRLSVDEPRAADALFIAFNYVDLY